MTLPPSPGSFTPWRLDRAPRVLAPRGTTTGTLSHYRYGSTRPVRQYAAVQSAGTALAGIMSGAGALAGTVEVGGMAFGVVVPLGGVIVNTGIVQGGMLISTTMSGAGALAATIELGGSLAAPGERDVLVWRCGVPLRILRPTLELSTGSYSFWRLDRAAAALQIGPPPEPPPEAFWRIGMPPRMLAPK